MTRLMFKRLLLLMVLLPVFAGGDVIRMADGTRIEGRVVSSQLPGSVSVRVPWCADLIRVKADQMVRMDLAPAPDQGESDVTLTLQNGFVLPGRLARIDKDGIAVKNPVGKTTFMAWDKVGTVTFAGTGRTLYSSARDGWQLDKWKGSKAAWVEKNGVLYRSRVLDPDGGTLRDLPEDGSIVSLVFGRVDYGEVIVGRHPKNEQQTLNLEFYGDEDTPNLVLLDLEVEGASSSSSDCYLPRDDIDITLEWGESVIRLFVNGLFFRAVPRPTGFVPALGFAYDADLSLRNCTVTAGVVGAHKRGKGQTDMAIHLRNGDMVSTAAMTPSIEAVKFKVAGNAVTVPLKNVREIVFPVKSQKSKVASGGMRMFANGISMGSGKLVSVTDKVMVLADAGGVRHTVPRTSWVVVHLPSPQAWANTPQILVKSFTDAIVKKDGKRLLDCLLVSYDGVIGEMQEFFGQAKIEKFQMTFLQPEQVGTVMEIQVKVSGSVTDSDGDKEEMDEEISLYMIPHHGRWYLQTDDMF